ncbi:MAG TPA: tRNA pseudouridine(55) synthase TruB [Spirochaetota bacterium]|nr:tRNA pseudouridine(55) synthase TruB [Spirochaetota bacterium]HOL56107.1 tRNA pseudouridine(55) synthase TruB [Spirochaetota bacterium]HPP04813.1 tRNA pseudouridine(55) synthase TruB [Spirochaetota bacterium]
MIESGLILVNKPEGITSFDIILRIRKIIGVKKIGHSGTLDKEAEGLMLVCFGKATKMLNYLIGLDKRYIGRIKFGFQTTTDDRVGEIINRYNGDIFFEVIKEKLTKYIGKIEQTPPKYSSLHINGERAYKLAIKNENFCIPSRIIEIYELNIIDYKNNELTIDIKCSSGTYIRAIARDLGIDTGYFGYLSYLQRVEIGNYCLKDAYSIEDIEKGNYCIIKPEDILYMFDKIELKENFFSHFKNGAKLSLNSFKQDILENKIYRVFCNNIFLGLIGYSNSILKYEFVY